MRMQSEKEWKRRVWPLSVAKLKFASQRNSSNTSLQHALRVWTKCPRQPLHRHFIAVAASQSAFSSHKMNGIFVTGRHFLCKRRYSTIKIIIMHVDRNLCVSEINVARNNGKRTQSTICVGFYFPIHRSVFIFFLCLVYTCTVYIVH